MEAVPEAVEAQGLRTSGNWSGAFKKVLDPARYRDVLQKSPEDRTEPENEDVAHYLSSLSIGFLHDFFHDDIDQVLADLSRVVRFQHVPSQTTLFSQDDASDKLYIIISGSVTVWVTHNSHEGEYPTATEKVKSMLRNLPQQTDSPALRMIEIAHTGQMRKRTSWNSRDSGGGGEREPMSLNINVNLPSETRSPISPSRRFRVTSTSSQDNTEDDMPRQGIDDTKANVETLVGIIRAGGPIVSFGEIGLLDAHAKRTATVKTDLDDCEFLTLSKQDFDRVLKNRYLNGLMERCKVLKQFPLFADLSPSHLWVLAQHVHRRFYDAKQLIATQNSQATHLFCLLSGEVGGTKTIETATKRGSLRISPQQDVDRDRVFRIEPGAIIGAKEALSNPPQSFGFTLRAISPCQMFVIAKDDYVSRVRADVVRRASQLF